MSWLSQYFLNPSFVLPGAALAAVPIIIHLLSRLRYKKVRFAAMEFLLQSDEMNRRRLIIEQLLLLALRVLAVLLIMLLLARLMLNPSGMLLMRGATTHHVLILDDSLSMRERADDRTAFERAVEVLERMLSQGGSRPGSLRVTVLTTTQPDRPLVTDRALDNAMLQELIPRLRNQTCSFRAATPAAALQAAEEILSADAGVSPQVHVITDLRESDWTGRPEVTEALKSLDGIDASVNLIPIAEQTRANLAVTRLVADTLSVAVGVPWRMNVSIRNFSAQKVSGKRAAVSIDGAELPVNLLIPDIEAESEIQVSHDVTFDSAGQHEVEIRLEEDVLSEDNSRFLVADVADKRVVLLIDDAGQQEDAGYVAAALSADPELTGLITEPRTSQVLTSADLSRYDMIYLLNVRDLPADATLLLSEYVRAGGGIAWFPGDQADTNWYNTTLQESDRTLFPVPLGTVQSAASDGSPAGATDAKLFQNPVFEQHPIFEIYNLPDSPFADLVQFRNWFGVTDEWKADDAARADGVRTLARLKNGDPIIFEHQLGNGRILTFLTSAGRHWTNWPIAPASPGYVVTHLRLEQYLQKVNDRIQVRELGDDIKFTWPVGQFTDSVEVSLPEPESEGDDASAEDTFLRLQAAPVTEAAAANVEPAAADEKLTVSLVQADRPGVYRVKRFLVDGDSHNTWLAMNVPASESDLAVADAVQIQQTEGLGHVAIVAAGTAGGLSGSDAGRDMRWFLLSVLIVVLVCEQLLSLRMSFHPEAT
ncbi:MAG: BatA domain-containing protein [Planctomycetaceae bacterium]